LQEENKVTSRLIYFENVDFRGKNSFPMAAAGEINARGGEIPRFFALFQTRCSSQVRRFTSISIRASSSKFHGY
jgi:hypothetical protein